jgi:hypothetical protein
MQSSGQLIFNNSPPPQNGESKDPINQGVEEAVKDLIKEEEKSRQKLDDLIQRSEKVLLKISTVFPFDLFPNDIIVDENKVNIIKREFFWSEQIHSIMIREINDVIVESNPFFATLIILDEGYREQEIRVNYLWKSEAMKARRIIQGLMVSLKGLSSPMLGSIENNHLSNQELVEKLETLGKAAK